ncbi:polysaccharide deacetylase family protein [Algisphaera agarilytica]|nr:polysaccharide deacetylase family protein [Algisphaera agarilytica]
MMRVEPASNPSAKRAVITTSWDDGHLEDLRLADLLETYRIPATFYIPRVDRLLGKPVLSADQLRQLADRGFEVGAHTMNHTVVTTVPDDVARSEIADSRKYIADATGRDCPMFCLPQGRFKPQHVEMIREAGYTSYRTVEMWSTAPPRPRGNAPFTEMPTTLQAQPQSPSSIARNLLKRRALSNGLLYLKLGRAAGQDWARQARALLQHVLTHGGVFHLWGHSWELEEFDQWDTLESVLAQIRDAADQAELLTNNELCQRG